MHDQVADDNKIFKSVIVTIYVEVFDFLHCAKAAELIVMALHHHVFYGRCDFNSVIMSVDREIFYMVAHPLLAAMLVD